MALVAFAPPQLLLRSVVLTRLPHRRGARAVGAPFMSQVSAGTPSKARVTSGSPPLPRRPPPPPPPPRYLAEALAATASTDPVMAAHAAASGARVAFFTSISLVGLAVLAASGDTVGAAKAGRVFLPRGSADEGSWIVPWLVKSIAALVAVEQANIRNGVYPRPPLTSHGPVSLVRSTLAYLAEVPVVEARRVAGEFLDVPVGSTTGVEAAVPATPYPDYYLRNFHFQTDGYLSAESARVYDSQVEVLFLGTADMMRRQALVPLAAWRRGVGAARLRYRRGRLSILNVPVGSGGVLPDLARAYPGADITNVELGPYYLAEAEARHRRSGDAGDPARTVSFVQANTETLPFSDGSFDVVISVFLLHELPPRARRAVMAEWARVLAPGGLLVVADSMQRSNSANGAIPFDLSIFPAAFHEPFYASYVTTDFDALASRMGLRPFDTRLALFSKVMSWVKEGDA
ncbi:hypothetical protein MMPV_009892 [Pyropia vietnamensis]